MAFHVNDNGDPGSCSAQPGKCPFGGVEEHYPTADEARQAYERTMGSQAAIVSHAKASREQEERMEVALFNLGSLPEDLEGSVPYVAPYREAADSFLDFTQDASPSEIMEHARHLEASGTAEEQLIAYSFLQDMGRR